MKAYVERVAAHGPDLEHPFHEDLDYYEGRAHGLRASAEDGTPRAVEAFPEAGAPLTQAGARKVVARRHGFASWAALRRHVTSLRDGGEPLARAYRALETHDLEGLRAQLDRFPGLATARARTATTCSGWPARPATSVSSRCFLEHGADPRSANAHGWTALHQAA